MTNIQQQVAWLTQEGSARQRVLAAYTLAELGVEGHRVLAEVANDSRLRADVRISAETALPVMAERSLLAVAQTFLRSDNPVVRYCGLRRCARSGLFEMMDSVRELCVDDTSFFELDEEISVGRVAARVRRLLSTGSSDPDFVS